MQHCNVQRTSRVDAPEEFSVQALDGGLALRVVAVEEVAVARKLSPTFQPDMLSLTNTRCCDAKSIETGEPDVLIATDETVNWWLVVFHVPPTA